MTRAARMRMAMEELGPTFIKLGQILSTRPDILPDDWIEEFQKLQSEVPAEPWDKIHAELVEELVLVAATPLERVFSKYISNRMRSAPIKMFPNMETARLYLSRPR